MSDRSRLATRAVVVATLGFAFLSARQIWARACHPVFYAGMPAMSAPWSPPPRDDTTEWYVSEGIVPPPPANATWREFTAWLGRHYPVLALHIYDDAASRAAKDVQLGGGPPRALFVEPGRGLVGREP